LLSRLGVRAHRTTREQPAARLTVEQPALIPLPRTRFEAGMVVSRLVGADFCVPYDTNRYSVPPRFASRSAKVRVIEGRLEIEIDGEVVAAHPLRSTRHKRYVEPEHEAEFRATCTSRHVLKQQFQNLGPIAESFANGLVEMHGGAAGYHMSQILKLADKFGVSRVAEALRHAARYGSYDHNAIARIVAAKPKPAPRGAVAEQDDPKAPSKKYLQGAGEHQRSLAGYRVLSTPAALPRPPSVEAEEDNDDGQ
jgi:hypothetical protein